MLRPIHHTFGPHVDFPTFAASWKIALLPWKWQKGSDRDALRERLSRGFSADCFLFGSGREGLLALFRALSLPKDSEVVIQGYTCVALPNAIHAAGLKPVYADCDADSLNLGVASVRKALSPRTKIVICQHTFGIPSDGLELRALCDERRLILLEDCAHVLPDVTGPKSVGAFGDFLMLSFGRDKAASGVSGGAILSRKREISARLLQTEEEAPECGMGTIARLLFYIHAYFKADLVYGSGIGKGILWLSGKLRLLVPVLTREEKHGHQSPLVRRMPNACATLALRELKKMHSVNNHRRVLTKFYLEAAQEHGWKFPASVTADLPLQKFPVFTEDADQIRTDLKKKNIHLDDGWTGAAVCPRSVDQAAAGYGAGTCPVAEKVARTILSLPTHPTMTEKQAMRLIAELRSIR